MYTVETTQNNETSALYAELELKYGPAMAQGLIDGLERSPQQSRREPSYMDVKAMSELQERCRAEALLSVWRLKEWRRTGGGNRHFDANLVSLEGAQLRRQCEESLRLYRHATENYFMLHRQAMAHFSAITKGFDLRAAQSV